MANNDNTSEAPKKMNWLDEVKADAEFNYLQRLREEEARKKHEDEKNKQNSSK